jgi:hypothetical protein
MDVVLQFPESVGLRIPCPAIHRYRVLSMVLDQTKDEQLLHKHVSLFGYVQCLHVPAFYPLDDPELGRFLTCPDNGLIHNIF